ncbi:MAG: regulatory protein RecX [Egibacteraceae bacterium]
MSGVGKGDMQDGKERGEVGEAVAFILRSTSARPQTEAEIAGRLRSREVPEEIAAAAMVRAKALGAIDDAAFARAWVEDRGTHRGYGAARLREELRRRLVPDELIDEAVGRLEGRDDLAVAMELACERAKRFPSTLSREAVARRLHGYLTRRGYPNGLAEHVAISVSGISQQR